ncbi:MAG: hypothetical protein VX574_05605, partial [Myxococcota bacterium]|nr:hypothetical protein [Myxococcota bacterium]
MVKRPNRLTTRNRSLVVALAMSLLAVGLGVSDVHAGEEPTARQKVGVLEKPNAYLSPSVKNPAPSEWFRENHDWGSGNLTGDWFGLRNLLGDHGVAVGIRYVAIPMGNLTGGLDRGFFGGGPLGVTVTVDTESLVGWEGGTLF